MSRRLRCAMVGGGRDAFIGAVHRHALALVGQYELVAGALSSSPEKAIASGRDLGLADSRNHASWQALLADEQRRGPDDRVDLVVVVTPNHMHHAVAAAFVDAGFHVACDKPLANSRAQADDLAERVARAGNVFAVTYNYTGYPMVREAREMVRAGAIGQIRKVIVEYHQGWLAERLEAADHKQAVWRTDPARAGLAGAIGDIGSHAENLAATVTGLQIESLCADLTSFVPGRQLDDDGSLLLRFVGGARGVLIASQVEAGNENDIRLRVFGERGMLDWRHEDPNHLVHAPIDRPRMILTRNSPWLSEPARRACRLPPGHPEAFIEAFANLYAGIAVDIRSRLAGHGPATASDADYPRIDAGVRGVCFVEKAVDSAASERKWATF